ncbi:MAG: hypothetical protein OQL20_09165 [Sedimenticola sp.]|nr:hypothetical protein [Sedimenticola sp.]
MKIENGIILLILIFLTGCQSGNSLTRDNSNKTYEVLGSAKHGYLLRYNGWGSEEQKIAKWHEKASEICGKNSYEGSPKIFNHNYGGKSIPAIAYGGGILGVLAAQAASGGGHSQVAAGPLMCKKET